MTTRQKGVRFELLGGFCVAILLAGVLWLFLLSVGRTLEVSPLSLFSAPSQIPPETETWILIGSNDELPADATCSGESPSLSVLQVERVSQRALAIRVMLTAQGAFSLNVDSAARGQRASVNLTSGPALPALCVSDNIQPEDMTNGSLLIGGPFLIYGFLPQEGVAFSAVRIHNRATGQWHSRDYAQEKAQKAAEPPIEVGPGFGQPDPAETLPDTDGDGILDPDEEAEPTLAPHDFIGVNLNLGMNTIDVIAVDERGFASWETIQVLAQFTTEEEGI